MASAATAEFFKGTGSMNVVVRPENSQAFRLVYARVHFRGTGATSPSTDLVMQLDSAAGEEHDAELYRALNVGLGSDVNLVLTDSERSDPSPWSCQPGDGLRFTWSRPFGTNWTWGLEVGLEVLVG